MTIEMDGLKADFARDGFVILRNVLAPESIAALNADMDRIMADEGQPNAHTVFNAAMQFPSVMKLLENETILPIVVNLLGFNLQLHVSTLSIKRPLEKVDDTTFRGGKIPTGATSASLNWHRDGPSPQFPHVQDFSVKVCYILSDLTVPDRGNTKVIPGSHRAPDYRPAQGDSNVPLPDEFQICGAPGDAFIFTQNLWHGASFNLSDVERRLAFIGYGACWTRPIDYKTVPPEIMEGASPMLRQLLGDVGPASFNHYMPESMPLKELWQGAEPVSSYAY